MDTNDKITAITDRIESRLRAIGEHEAAIRTDLAELAGLRPDEPSEALLDIDQACRRLRVSRATLFRLMAGDPDLRWLKIANRTRFRPEDLAAYTAAKVTAAAKAS